MTWLRDELDGVTVFRPRETPKGFLVAFSAGGQAPAEEETPTPFLARRLSSALGLDGLPLHWARQIHGNGSVTIRHAAPPGGAASAGECDALATSLSGVGLVVQVADCVPILLASSSAVAAAHAGWRGTARNVASAAVASLRGLGGDPARARAWLGPSIGACCYEVGGDVAAQFAGEFVRRGCGGGFLLDLKAVNVAQLEAAGVPRDSISVHPACTKCGGATFASYRRDGSKAGRMIALVARL